MRSTCASPAAWCAASVKVLAWRGIPYAAPPIGGRRFRAPQPVIAWPGVRDASCYGDVAQQSYRGQFKGASPRVRSSEDCLTVGATNSNECREGILPAL
ncbi:carboxylesterase family protein [Cryobacterium aureum]|uniref:carboxylesterase family protein n=1 Tax=Cryobacterium aureum TaxID=995037 RepID=UPI001F0C5266|nr:carboxylesterase family protein [Cryobacterium aureum]